MAAWSNIFRSTGQKVLQIGAIVPKKTIQDVQIRNSSHGPRIFRIEPSRWQWHKTKDLVHFYVTIGVVPLTIATFISYVFVGPAQLQPIPEDYIPKHWEYYRNPITRFFMRYFNQSHQELYEKTMHHFYEETRKAQIIGLQRRVEDLIRKRKDYQEYYYIPYNAEHVYESREFYQKEHALLNEFTEEDKKKMIAEREDRIAKSR